MCIRVDNNIKRLCACIQLTLWVNKIYIICGVYYFWPFIFFDYSLLNLYQIYLSLHQCNKVIFIIQLHWHLKKQFLMLSEQHYLGDFEADWRPTKQSCAVDSNCCGPSYKTQLMTSDAPSSGGCCIPGVYFIFVLCIFVNCFIVLLLYLLLWYWC